LERYPWQLGTPRISETFNITFEEKQQIEKQLPNNLPNAQIVSLSQFTQLTDLLHARAQKSTTDSQRQSLSQDISDYIKHRLILSGAVKQFQCAHGLTYYALIRDSYCPTDDKERLYVMVDDMARYFRMLKNWQERQPHTLRFLEHLDIKVENLNQALEELDIVVRDWANKYHDNDGTPIVLQAMVGLQEDE
jgi:Heterocyst differentiation regulator C-terminal Hood domain/Peptidase family S48